MKSAFLHTRIFIVLSLFLLCFPIISRAAIIDVSSGDSLNTVTLSSDPQYPKANEEVVLSIESFSTNLNSALIVWYVNGAVVAQGTGIKEITTETGPLDSVTSIAIDITPQGEKPFQKQFSLKPSDVSFIWEAKTYTPPFYKGKALFTAESPVTITAIPQFATGQSLIPAENLVYQWKQDDRILSTQSGYGKSSVEIKGNYWGRKDPVHVSVTSIDKAVTSQKTLTLVPQKSLVLAYENNPLLGTLFNRAITGPFSINQDSEVSFFVAPYFFISKLLSSGDTKYSWSMNGKLISDQQGGNTVTFRDSGNGGGESKIRVDVSQKSAVYQTGSTNFSINFK